MAILSYDQVMRFDTATSLLAGVPPAGTIAYANDTASHYVYVGTSWLQLTTKDIHAIDAGNSVVGVPTTGDVLIFTDAMTTSGGNVVFPMTTNHTTTGTAWASTILSNSIQLGFVDTANLYAVGTPTISSDKKTITVAVTKQSQTGATVLGIGVITTLAQAAAPDGVTVKLYATGIAA